MQLLDNIIDIPPDKIKNDNAFLKAQALKNGDTYYFTGIACRRGHIAKRFAKNSVCKECDTFHKLNNGKNSELKNKYGITFEQYNEMLQAQNNVCKICKQPETKLVNKKVCMLAVDHCHKTNQIRGLLCYNCNVGIGFFKHNSSFLHDASLYCEEA